MSAIRAHAGFRVGHVTRADDRTGVTAILFDQPALTAAEVRGAAPGTRDLEMLKSGMLAQSADAIILTGGSTFGLRTIDGALSQLVQDGRGIKFGNANIPLVPGAVVFDLGNGSSVAPDIEDGAGAIRVAVPIERTETGRVGAGTGVRWGHLRRKGPSSGGFGIGQVSLPEGMVTAVVVVNALGNVLAASEDIRKTFLDTPPPPLHAGEHTTLISIITDIACDHDNLVRLCVAGHDGLARSISPAHTMYDGDVVFVSTIRPGTIATDGLLRLFIATELAVEAAIVSAIAAT